MRILYSKLKLILFLFQAACTFGPKYIKKTTAKSEGSPAKPQSPRAGARGAAAGAGGTAVATGGTPGAGADLVKKKAKKKKKSEFLV